MIRRVTSEQLKAINSFRQKVKHFWQGPKYVSGKSCTRGTRAMKVIVERDDLRKQRWYLEPCWTYIMEFFVNIVNSFFGKTTDLFLYDRDLRHEGVKSDIMWVRKRAPDEKLQQKFEIIITKNNYFL